jgi:hypothetical protein
MDLLRIAYSSESEPAIPVQSEPLELFGFDFDSKIFNC